MADKMIEKEIIERTMSGSFEKPVKKIRQYCLAYCTALRSVSFPNVTSLDAYTFCNCTGLRSVSLPNVTSIGQTAFYGCASLISVSFPNATSIGASAFGGCTNLLSVSLPNVKTIDDAGIATGAFQDCTSLTYVDLPHAESIGARAFSDCPDLEVHLHPGLVLIKNIGEMFLSAAYDPPKGVYFHYTDADEVLFSPADAIGQGSSKGTLSYNIYTDNTTIKDGVLSKADQYTIVNVYHLDGSDWV